MSEQAQHGRPEAAAEIWTWRPAPPPAKPATGPIRLRGAIQASVGLAVAGTLAWFGYRTPAAIVGGIAVLLALAALLSPLGLYAAIEHGTTVLGGWIGKGLTWVLLPFLFYVFFLPFSVLFRRGRRDAMQRFFEANATSYWTARDGRNSRTASASHERQY